MSMSEVFIPYESRYREVWDCTLDQGELAPEHVAKSRYYFEPDLSEITPIEVSVYGMAALLPMPPEVQERFTELWQDIMDRTGHPSAYPVEPQNRHVELIVFSRPEEESLPQEIIDKNVSASFNHFQDNPPKPFSLEFRFPFITPDGTVVSPGFPTPETSVEDIRTRIRSVAPEVPSMQSRWFHTSLGRILEPIPAEQLQPILDEMESRWGEVVADLRNRQTLLDTRAPMVYGRKNNPA
jgi:hypothetical protein